MADDFFSKKYKTQRANQDIAKDLAALETPTTGTSNDDDGEELKAQNPFKPTMDVISEDGSGGYTMDDLLNGYVVDEETLSAIDECLLYISSEWDLSDILSKDITDCERLINQKCAEAHSIILSSIIDPPNILYDTLLRLARKMMAVSLVMGNQKMVYVPQNIEELEEIGSRLNGLNGIISIRKHKRTGHKSIASPDAAISDDDIEIDLKQNDIDNQYERSPSPQVDPLADTTQDLEALIFGNRVHYKETAICKKREKEYLDGRKKGISIGAIGIKRTKSKEKMAETATTTTKKEQYDELHSIEEQIDNNKPEPDGDGDADTNNDGIVKQGINGKRLSNSDELKPLTPTSQDPIEMGTINRATSQETAGLVKKAHPNDIKCEGCGNLINFVQDYDDVICYSVPIHPNRLFYFHDAFCVTLRRLKESIRRYVMDRSLPESRRAETTVGYVRNLMANFNTLITTGGVLPRPNPLTDESGGGIFGGTGQKDMLKEKIRNVAFLRSNAHKLILLQQALEGREAKNFEDEYSWKFKDIPQSIQYANMVIYGPCLAKYVVQQLLSKQLESLWLTLAFVTSGMTATKSLEIVEEHRTDLAKVKEMEHLDLVLTSMIEAADYTIAMALYLSAYMMENAERDLSRSEDFQTIGEKYIRIASQLVASVESDHLLSLLLETPTDIAHLSVFEIAIKQGIDDFMDDSRIQMLMAHMWSEFDFLDPARNYRTQDIQLFELLGRLAKQPARFYYCPVGRYWTQSVMYMVYVFVCTAVVYEANYELNSALSGAEWCMWIFNIGFVAGEITQMAFEGVSYLTDVGNYFDVLIMLNWSIIAIMRFGCKSVFKGSQQCTASNLHETPDDGLSRNKNAVVIYMGLFCAQICILWSRVCLIFATSRSVGPFISMIPGMMRDIIKWAFVLSIFYIGYSFGTHFIIAGDVSELCGNDDGDLHNFSVVAEYNFILLMGQSEWSLLEANDCMDTGRSLLLKLYMYGFSVLGTVLLLNLLIAMMASTYEQIREGTAKQVNFARAEQTYSLSHRNAIIPPPLNVLVFAFSVLWFTFEFLVWLCSGGKYILNIEKLVPVHVDYDKDFDQFDNKNARDIDATPLKCGGGFQKLKDPSALLKQKIAKRYGETARYCQFCRCYMRINGDISHYFKLFINYRLDEADVKFMKSLMQNAGICPQCYRPYRIYEVTETGMKTNRLYRWQVILELNSFYVFMLVIYIPLIILIALPALFNAILARAGDATSDTKIVGGNRASIIKDDKYVQLVENIVEKEGTTDSEVLSTQVNQLNRKLIQVKMNQQNAANVLAEQSMELEDHSRILNGMVPYIKKIDTKMDESMMTSKSLHQQQIEAFELGMKQQSVKLEASKDVLDVHTDYNKQHQTKLQEQMLVAQRHAEEMQLFKQQLDELKALRAEDEKLKREQAQRQEKLEKQHAEEIKSFNKELKQQRVLREMEAAKQAKSTKQQQEQLQQAHQEQLKTLQKQIEQQQYLRSIEEQKMKEEQEKRELLAERQQQDMAILTAQLEQLRLMKDAEDKKRAIELKMRKQQEKKMKDVEKEILRIKQSKKRQKNKTDSFALQQTARVEQLQKQLMTMKVEQQKQERADKQKKEVEEIKSIQHKSRVQQLKEQMSRMIRDQEKAQKESVTYKQKAEKDRMKHKIQMEKMKQSMTKLELTIIDSNNAANYNNNDDKKEEEEDIGSENEWSHKLEFSEEEQSEKSAATGTNKEYKVVVDSISDNNQDHVD